EGQGDGVQGFSVGGDEGERSIRSSKKTKPAKASRAKSRALTPEQIADQVVVILKMFAILFKGLSLYLFQHDEKTSDIVYPLSSLESLEFFSIPISNFTTFSSISKCIQLDLKKATNFF